MFLEKSQKKKKECAVNVLITNYNLFSFNVPR